MLPVSTVELTDLKLVTDIGTYGPNDTVPLAHLLDLTLTIDPAQVLIPSDAMDHVFDYDPLIAEIDAVARSGNFETQERLVTLIVEICARYPDIQAVSLHLRKTPVLNDTGYLGVRLRVEPETLKELRGDEAVRA